MDNPGYSEENLYKDRNESFRHAVRAPKRNKGFLWNELGINHCQDGEVNDESVKVEVQVTHKGPKKAKYNWKRFLPWAPRSNE